MRNLKALVLIGVLLVLTGAAYAQFAGGSGTEADPWQVSTVEHLYNVRNYLGSGNANKYFVQTADFDLGVAPWNQGSGWEPIGNNDSPFYGHYNGDNHTISNLFIYRFDNDYQGLFGNTFGSIHNLGMENVAVVGHKFVGGLSGYNNGSIDNCHNTGNVDGYERTGGLVGYNYSSGSISNCNTSVNVSGRYFFTGGLVGYNYTSASISNCHSIGDVIGRRGTGGLVGQNYNNANVINCYSTGQVSGYENTGGLMGGNSGNISNCYSTGDVIGTDNVAGLSATNSGTINKCFSTGTVNGGYETGGLVGHNYSFGSNIGSISNCYSTSNVNGNSKSGGLVASHTSTGTLINNYSTGNVFGQNYTGGFIGYRLNSGAISNCYWDTQTSGQTISAGGEGRTTAEMTWPHAANTYVGWDFVNIWAGDPSAVANAGYPYLLFQVTQTPNPAINPCPIDQAEVIQWDSDLSWQADYLPYSDNPPKGFKLYVGTDNPPTNILYGLDLLGSLSYDPPLSWSEGTSYFWRIVPYNRLGDAVNCPVWSFTTIHDTPYAEISVDQISFGNVWIDHIATKSFTVSNQGDQNLEITLLISSGPFTITTSSGRSPRLEQPRLGERNGKSDRTELSFTVPAVSSETVYVHFLPTAQQDYTRNIFVETNAPNLPTATIPLTGTGYVLYAEFMADPGTGDVPLEVSFTNQSVTGINQSLWDFGDGNTSEEMNLTHTFTQEGVYNVQLTVWDDYFSTSITHPVTVIAHPLLTCSQASGHTFSKTYLEEQSDPFELILQSSGTDTLFVTNVHWKSQNRDSYFQYEFGQLGVAIVPGAETGIQVWFAPLAEGVFADTLCIANNSENYPLLEIPFSGRGYQLHAGFNYDPPSGDVPLTVNFTDISTEDIIQWDWDFGDGGTASAQNPVYVFQTEGSYQVDLSVSDGIHFDSVSQYVQVIAHPMLACEQTNGHTFTKTYLNELSYPFEVILQSSGTDTLSVASVHWKSQNRDGYFHYEFEGIGAAIVPGDNRSIQVWFAPLTEGVFADTLCIVNNSENQPLLEIPFSGRGYQLHASFDYDPPSGDVPLTVSFTDTSTEDIIQWNWDFGDGFTSSQQNPVHVFETEGTYNVELTVSDGIHSDSTAMSVVVIAHALIGFQDDFSYNFDIVYLGDSSEAITLTLQSTGTDTLFVNNIHWHDSRPEFHYAYGDFSTPILPGHTANIDVWFEPLMFGAFSDTLIIETNAENQPVLKVRFSGKGEYVPPKAPVNVYVTINGNHAVIHWDEVTQTIYDTPFNPDCYFVFLAADPYGTFTFLGSSTDLSYTQYMVAAYQQYMFYKVIAYKDFGEGRFDPESLGINPGMTEEEVVQQLRSIGCEK